MTDRTMSSVVTALEKCWDALKRDHPELPYEVIVLASKGRRPVHGYFAPDRWIVDGSGMPRAEVLIAGESLIRGVVPVFGTLVHEATHALAHTRGIQDTSRQSRYHNKAFKALAEEMGLEMGYMPGPGWAETIVPDATVKRYKSQVGALNIALKMVRKTDQPGPAKVTSIAVACECVTFRGSEKATTTWLEKAVTLCGSCGKPFTLKEDTRKPV